MEIEKEETQKKNESSINTEKNIDKKNLKLPKNMSTINLVVLGMAGSGKTTFVEKLEEEIANKDKESYIINIVLTVKCGNFQIKKQLDKNILI